MLLILQTSSRSEPAFIKTGFSNWKKSEVFAKHEKSDCHKHSLQAHRHWKFQKPIHHQIDEENERQESFRQQNVCNLLSIDIFPRISVHSKALQTKYIACSNSKLP